MAEFDIVVLGATGATGREVVRYLAGRMAEAGGTWAVAGRDRARCHEVLAANGALGVPVFDLDVTDRGAVQAVVVRAATILNVVGPYARFGRVPYEVCAETGTTHVDVCGEVDWLGEQTARLHDLARSTGSRIVIACGFEALPFDLTTLALARTASTRWHEPLASVEIAISVRPDPPVLRWGDIVSGGTVRSGADAIRRGVAAARDVRLLDPRPHRATPLDVQPWRHPTGDRWLGPLLPTPYINPAVVYRTVGLMPPARPWFADDFRYRDGLVSDELVPGVDGVVASTWLSGLQVMNQALTQAPSTFNDVVADLAELLGPRSGEGPSDAHLGGWTWRLDAVANTVGGHSCRAVVDGAGHPGYRSTAALVAEAALALTSERGKEPGGGILTPAVALGHLDHAHWRRAGCAIQIEPA